MARLSRDVADQSVAKAVSDGSSLGSNIALSARSRMRNLDLRPIRPRGSHLAMRDRIVRRTAAARRTSLVTLGSASMRDMISVCTRSAGTVQKPHPSAGAQASRGDAATHQIFGSCAISSRNSGFLERGQNRRGYLRGQRRHTQDLWPTAQRHLPGVRERYAAVSLVRNVEIQGIGATSGG
jgi:hypothetical protein